MAKYRFYALDGRNPMNGSSRDLECANDAEAITRVLETEHGSVEIWQSARLVKRIETSGAKSLDAARAPEQSHSARAMYHIHELVNAAMRLSDSVLANTPEDIEDARASLLMLSVDLRRAIPGHPSIEQLDRYRATFGRVRSPSTLH